MAPLLSVKTNTDGVEIKLCRGPLHELGGEWLSLRDNFTKKAKDGSYWQSQCAECRNLAHRQRRRHRKLSELTEPMVMKSRYYWIFEELRRHLGDAEAARRMGMSPNSWYLIIRNPVGDVEHKTVEAAVRVLAAYRLELRRGTPLRGRVGKNRLAA